MRTYSAQRFRAGLSCGAPTALGKQRRRGRGGHGVPCPYKEFGEGLGAGGGASCPGGAGRVISAYAFGRAIPPLMMPTYVFFTVSSGGEFPPRYHRQTQLHMPSAAFTSKFGSPSTNAPDC